MTDTTSTRRPQTGWQPDTPAEDTVLRQFVLGQAAAWATAATAAGGRVRDDERFVAADHGTPSGLFNGAVLVRPLHGGALDATLDEIEDFCAVNGAGPFHLWSAWPTPDLHERGWQLEGHPPMLLRPGGLPVDHRAPSDLDLVDVDDAGRLATWCDLAVTAFPFEDVPHDRAGTLLYPAVLDDPRLRFFLGLRAGRPVGVGATFVDHGLSTLFLAATARRARGGGVYRAMATHRMALHPDLPHAAIVSDLSRPVLQHRLGFLPVSRFTLWTRPRPDRAVTGGAS